MPVFLSVFDNFLTQYQKLQICKQVRIAHALGFFDTRVFTQGSVHEWDFSYHFRRATEWSFHRNQKKLLLLLSKLFLLSSPCCFCSSFVTYTSISIASAKQSERKHLPRRSWAAAAALLSEKGTVLLDACCCSYYHLLAPQTCCLSLLLLLIPFSKHRPYLFK